VVATNPAPDLVLTPVNGPGQTLLGWLTMFDLVLVALDPFTYESAWIIDAAARILTVYDQADCRVAWLVAGTPDEARLFLGPWAREILTFADPEREAIKALGLEHLPAIVHIGVGGEVVDAAEGWDPPAWRRLTEELSRRMSWTKPVIPGPHDPAPFPGSPAVA